MRDTNAALSPLELRVEVTKSLGSLRHELLQSFYDRRPIAERYRDGSVAVHIHCFAGEDSFCISWINADSDGAPKGSKVLVFVGVGEINEPLHPVASLKRLQPLNRCDMVAAEISFQTIPAEELVKEFFRVCDRKLCSLYNLPSIEAREFINQVLQGGSEVLDDIAKDSAEPQWSRLINKGAEGPVRNLTEHALDDDLPLLVIEGHSISYDLGKLPNEGLERVQVLTCPVNPLVSAIQRMHEVSSTYERQPVERQPAGSAQTEDQEGSRDSGADAQAGRECPEQDGEVKAAVNPASQPEEVASLPSPARRHGANSAKRTRLGSPEDA